MTRAIPLHVVNLLAYLFNTVVTYGIGSMGWFDRPDNATVSAKYQSIVTPAGWAFVIWGVIFLSQLIWVIWQQRSSGEEKEQIRAVKLNYLWVCLAQVGWTISFSFERIGISLVFMVLILYFLLRIMGNLQAYNDYLIYKFPFSIHAAWIIAATAVNLSVVLVWLEASAAVQFWVGIVSEIVLLLVALRFVLTEHPDFTLPSVLAWALLGVCYELSSPKDSIGGRFSQTEIDCVRYGALSGVFVVLLSLAVKLVILIRKRPSEEHSEETSYLRAN